MYLRRIVGHSWLGHISNHCCSASPWVQAQNFQCKLWNSVFTGVLACIPAPAPSSFPLLQGDLSLLLCWNTELALSYWNSKAYSQIIPIFTAIIINILKSENKESRTILYPFDTCIMCHINLTHPFAFFFVAEGRLSLVAARASHHSDFSCWGLPDLRCEAFSNRIAWAL